MSRLIKRAIGLVLIFLLLLVVGWYQLFREVEQPEFKDPEQLFNYGSIGTEAQSGIPYWIWRVMPTIFSDYLPGPGGYSALGFFWEPGQLTPVGFSVKTVGQPRVAFNCAFCHQSSYRESAQALPKLVSGGVGNRVDSLGYARFLSQSALDDRFNSDVLMAEINRTVDLNWLDRLTYRYLLIPLTKKALIRLGQNMKWTELKPDWGRGRIAPFNPLKYGVLNLPLDDTIGNADMMPLWNMASKTGPDKAFHWDGLNTDLHEVVLSSAIGDDLVGKHYTATIKQNLKRIQQWISDTPPPNNPFGFDKEDHRQPDQGRYQQGATLFQNLCADCHDSSGSRVSTVIPVAEIGTDPHRAQMWTDAARDRYNAYDQGYPWGFSHFQNVEGYLAPLLDDGLWLRAPYLHNGSVPSLRDLLTPPELRPEVFYRGFDLIDWENGGFVTSGYEAEWVGFRFDTRLPGNGNQGHSYGTGLDEADKEALLEYLKTL